MNLVSWNSAISIRKRDGEGSTGLGAAEKNSRLWCDVARPTSRDGLVGNERAVRATESWFRAASCDPRASSCLFVHGESGTGKSTAVSLIAEELGFEVVATYADQSRTPARLEGVVREAGVHGPRGVVVLDDFEMFLSETTSLRVLSKLLRQLLGEGGGRDSRCLFVIISNSTHKCFGALQDISTIVRFERLRTAEVFRIYTRLAARVRSHSYVPPMALYLSSVTSSGTITHKIQQLQLLYADNTATNFAPRPKRQKTSKRGCDPIESVGRSSNGVDCISYLWSDTYTDKILEHMIDDRFDRSRVVDRLVGFERSRLDIVRGQLHEEYVQRVCSMEQLRHVSESISLADTMRIEVHEDGLHDGENKESWSENDVWFICNIARGVVAIKGRERRNQSWSRKPHARLSRGPALVL